MKNTMPSISWWDNVIKDDLNMVNAVDSRCFFFFCPYFLLAGMVKLIIKAH